MDAYKNKYPPTDILVSILNMLAFKTALMDIVDFCSRYDVQSIRSFTGGILSASTRIEHRKAGSNSNIGCANIDDGRSSDRVRPQQTENACSPYFGRNITATNSPAQNC